jgi:hypothetical protein
VAVTGVNMRSLGRGSPGFPSHSHHPMVYVKCQSQSRIPPRQGRLKQDSGEVACPASMFTVLRRRREPDLCRAGWAAPLCSDRVHTHFPETEHGWPAHLAKSSCRPSSHGGSGFLQAGTLMAADGAKPGSQQQGWGCPLQIVPLLPQVHCPLPG